MTFDDHLWSAGVDLLVRDVRAAANRECFDCIDPVARAVVRAREMVREARRLHKYPTVEQLERETKRAA